MLSQACEGRWDGHRAGKAKHFAGFRFECNGRVREIEFDWSPEVGKGARLRAHRRSQ
jgi:hypothetical protein